jgi:hypothetical protein
MSQNAELFARWQLAASEAGKTAFKTQDELLRRLVPLTTSAEFLGLASDYFVTKRAKYEVRLHAWCGAADGAALTGLVLGGVSPCEVVEMEVSKEATICHPAFGRADQELIFRAYLRQVTEIGTQLLTAAPGAAKRCAIQSKYAPDPERLLSPTLGRLSPRYRSFDERSRELFWKLFKTKETDTPWSYFFYNLILGLDWSPEQMTEAEATALLLGGPSPSKESERCPN